MRSYSGIWIGTYLQTLQETPFNPSLVWREKSNMNKKESRIIVAGHSSQLAKL